MCTTHALAYSVKNNFLNFVNNLGKIIYFLKYSQSNSTLGDFFNQFESVLRHACIQTIYIQKDRQIDRETRDEKERIGNRDGGE